jgi:hypothetical protein
MQPDPGTAGIKSAMLPAAVILAYILCSYVTSALGADLPRGWVAIKTSDEQMYYYNNETHGSQWELPTTGIVHLGAVHPRVYHRKRMKHVMKPNFGAPVLGNTTPTNAEPSEPHACNTKCCERAETVPSLRAENTTVAQSFQSDDSPVKNGSSAIEHQSVESNMTRQRGTALRWVRSATATYNFGRACARWIWSTNIAHRGNDTATDADRKPATVAHIAAIITRRDSVGQPPSQNTRRRRSKLPQIPVKRNKRSRCSAEVDELTALRVARQLQVKTIASLAQQLERMEGLLHNATQPVPVATPGGGGAANMHAEPAPVADGNPSVALLSVPEELLLLVNALDLLSHFFYTSIPLNGDRNNAAERAATIASDTGYTEPVQKWYNARLAEYAMMHNLMSEIHNNKEGPKAVHETISHTTRAAGDSGAVRLHQPQFDVTALVEDQWLEDDARAITHLQCQLDKVAHENAVLRAELNVASTLLCTLRGHTLYASTTEDSGVAWDDSGKEPNSRGVAAKLQGWVTCVYRWLAGSQGY